MSPGEWSGNNIYEDKRILLLGESHYSNEYKVGESVPFETRGVVQDYLSHKKGLSTAKWDRFFDKIVASFGYTLDKSDIFFDKVFFGNYIDEICGIGTGNTAKEVISKRRTCLNNQLINFVNKQDIDAVVCFSRLVFNNLPWASSDEHKTLRHDLSLTNGKADYVSEFTYIENVEHKYCDILLKKPLIVYGVRHPSARCGYDAYKIYSFFKEQNCLQGMCYQY